LAVLKGLIYAFEAEEGNANGALITALRRNEALEPSPPPAKEQNAVSTPQPLKSLLFLFLSSVCGVVPTICET